MVPSIARQSVIIKCLRKKSVLLGNYEFYYVAGLLKKLYQPEVSEEMKPQELFDRLMEAEATFQPQNENEEYLIKLLKRYRPLEEFDAQMQQLFRWGAKEEYLWQVTTSQVVE